MNQKLSKWASIAEIASSIAVVVTLVFLLVGVQENTEIVRAATYDRNIDSLNETRGWIANNPDLAMLYRAFMNDESAEIDEPQITQLNLLMNALFGNFEKAYFAYQYGHIGDAEWSRFDKQICIQYSHMVTGPAILIESLQRASAEEFLGYIRSTCVVETGQ